MRASPNFGKELRRDFEVHENCYDCADFYDGCPAWRASRDFACQDFNRLPDVLPGTCGQKSPPPRRQAACGLAPKPVEHQTANRKARTCGCGVALSKSKRLCDTCRTESRRQTRREYMRSYMGQRRSPTSGSDSGVPSTHEITHAMWAGGEDQSSTGHRTGGVLSEQTSVLTNAF